MSLGSILACFIEKTDLTMKSTDVSSKVSKWCGSRGRGFLAMVMTQGLWYITKKISRVKKMRLLKREVEISIDILL